MNWFKKFTMFDESTIQTSSSTAPISETNKRIMDTQQKCVKILKAIVELNQDINDKTGILFSTDWAGNSLTVEFKGGHTHCGNPEGNFKQLIDSLYNMLCENKGLSLA